MATLYQNYTVVVQESESPYAPNSDLQLLLYEGRLELKVNPATAQNDVFDYGTTTLATPVYDRNGSISTALVADSTDRPGEYDFVEIDLNRSGSQSAAGETVYSVVARPASDASLGSFERAKIIQDRVDLSDTNVKQYVYASKGGFDTIAGNIAFAGGSTAFSLYTESGDPNSDNAVHLELTALPDSITDLYETPSGAPPDFVGGTTITKLMARVKVHYSNGSDKAAIWEGVPVYKTSADRWVCRVQGDMYNVYRSMNLGTGYIALLSAYQDFKVSISLEDYNIRIKAVDSLPTSVDSGFEEHSTFVIKKESTGEYRCNNIHFLDPYSATSYKWKQVLAAPEDSETTEYTNNPNRSKAVLADGSNCFSGGIINYKKWWPRGTSLIPLRMMQGTISTKTVGFAFQWGSSITAGQGYSDISWTNIFSAMPSDGSTLNSSEYYLGVGNWTYADSYTTPSYNLDITGTKGLRVYNAAILSTDKYLGLYNASGHPTPPVNVGALYYYDSALWWKDLIGTEYEISWKTGSVVNHSIVDHDDVSYATGTYLDSLYGTDGTDGIVRISGTTSTIANSSGTALLSGNSSTTYVYGGGYVSFQASASTVYIYPSGNINRAITISSSSIFLKHDSEIYGYIGGGLVFDFTSSISKISCAADSGDYISLSNTNAIIAHDSSIALKVGASAYNVFEGTPTTTTISAYHSGGARTALFATNSLVMLSCPEDNTNFVGLAGSYIGINVNNKNNVYIIEDTVELRIDSSYLVQGTATATSVRLQGDSNHLLYLDSSNSYLKDSVDVSLRIGSTKRFHADTSNSYVYDKNGNTALNADDSYTQLVHDSQVKLTQDSDDVLVVDASGMTLTKDNVYAHTDQFLVSSSTVTPNTDSLVRIVDTENVITDIDSYSTTEEDYGYINFRKANQGSVTTLSTSTSNGHYLGGILFSGVDTGNSRSVGAKIYAYQNGPATGSGLAGVIRIQTNNNSGANSYVEIAHHSFIIYPQGGDIPGSVEWGYISRVGANGHYLKIPYSNYAYDNEDGADGEMYLDTLNNILKIYNNGAWRTVASVAS